MRGDHTVTTTRRAAGGRRLGWPRSRAAVAVIRVGGGRPRSRSRRKEGRVEDGAQTPTRARVEGRHRAGAAARALLRRKRRRVPHPTNEQLFRVQAGINIVAFLRQLRAPIPADRPRNAGVEGSIVVGKRSSRNKSETAFGL